MDPNRLAEIEALFTAALQEPPGARAAWLAAACEGREEIRTAVVELLTAHETAGAYFDGLAADMDDSRPLAFELAAASATIGPYRLMRPLGRGGMGTVFLAVREDGHFDQQVALKVLPIGIGDAGAIRRFRAERQIVARLAHPNIARLLDGGVTDDQRPYFVMELVDGLPITDWCEKQQASLEDRLGLFLQVTDAVKYAHGNLVAHRDIKPGNILVTANGQVKLLDFGIARLLDEEAEMTRTSDRALTPAYSAPESVRGLPASTSADVFSLGVVLYELLAGSRPFRGATITEVTQQILGHHPPRPSDAAGDRLGRRLRGDLDTICLTALRKEPDRRYPSVERFAEDVRRHLTGLPVTARPDTHTYRIGKFVRRHRVGVAVAAAAGVLLLAFATTLAVQARRVTNERDKAAQVAALLVDLFEVSDPGEARGATVTAREVLDRGATRVEATLAAQPELQSALLDVLARVHQNLGLYQKAGALLERSMATKKELGQAETAPAAATLARLGEVRRQRGEYAAAETTLRDALALFQRVSPGDDAALAVTTNHLGKVLVSQGCYDEASGAIQAALAHARRVQPPLEFEIAESLNTLGVLAFSRGDFSDAEGRFREALAIRSRVLGPDHPLIPASLNNLAFLTEAFEIRRAALGASHPLVAQSLHNLALLKRAQGQNNEAENLLRQALAIQEKVLPANHPDLAATRTALTVGTR